MTIENPLPASLWAGGRGLGDPQISPDGTLVSFVASYAGGNELVVVDIDGGPETWLPLDPKIARGPGAHAWLPNGSQIVYLAKDGLVHLFDIASLNNRVITQGEMDIATLSVSPDGSSVAFVDDMQHVYVVDIESGKQTRLTSDADFAFDPAWSYDSLYVAWQEWDVPNMPWDGSRIAVRRADASEPIKTVAGGDNIGVQQPRFSPDGQYLAFLSDENGFLNTWVVDLPDYSMPRALVGEYREAGNFYGPGQRSYSWTHDGAGVIYCRNDHAFGTLVTYDLASHKKFENDAQDQYASLFSLHGKTVSVVNGPQKLPEIQLIEGDNVRVLARSSYKGLEELGTIPEWVEWNSEDGTLINGRLYRAHGVDGPAPMLLWLHGGPTDQSPATVYARWEYLLQRGWSVLVVDYRGSTGWGRKFAQELRYNWGVLDVADCVAAAQTAVERGWATPGKVVPFGGSAGGFTALSLLTQYPDMWAAGVTMYPVSDLMETAQNSWRFEAHYFDTLVGPLPDSEDIYTKRSPINHAEKITVPLLVLHGDNDIVVPIDQSKELVRRVQAADGTIEFHIYEGEGHGWRSSATRIDELERIEAFLNRYVVGVENEKSVER